MRTHDTLEISGKAIKIERGVVRLARLAAEQYDTVADPPSILLQLRDVRPRIDLFTFVQKLSQTSPEYNYSLEWDNLAALPVSTFDHWWTKQINGKTRNMARRAEKSGVTVREVPFDAALVAGISRIYNESPVRQGKTFWHYGKALDTVRRENGTFLDRSVFIGAYWEGSLIGFAKLVSDEDSVQAGLMQIVSMISHRDKAPTNALIAQAVRSCASRGVPNLFYSRFAFGKRQRDSLSDFKQHNGFQRVDLPRYYVPLTRKGVVAMRLGLHRNSLIDHIPASLQTTLRDLRDALTQRRAHITPL